MVLAGDVVWTVVCQDDVVPQIVGSNQSAVRDTLMRRRIGQAWRMLACAATRTFAARVPVGSDGNTPQIHGVVADHRSGGVSWPSLE